MYPSSSAGRQLAISPDRDSNTDIGRMTEREDIDNSESLPLLQMDVGADSEHISAEGSSGIRADDQRDMDAVPSNAGFVINNSTFNDIQGDYYHVFLLADI
ncbi:hypothetical protein AX14_011009 [Amanita brunnescens Koide BX004]|nr:hypothetical protein AX14_011009 [Amanita brunnescens Koide BX004]